MHLIYFLLLVYILFYLVLRLRAILGLYFISIIFVLFSFVDFIVTFNLITLKFDLFFFIIFNLIGLYK